MSSVFDQVRGVCEVKISGVSPERLLNRLAENGIVFWGAEPGDSYTLLLRVYKSDFETLKALAARSQCHVDLLNKSGVPYFLHRLRGRYTLMLGLLICMFGLMCSSLFIWDIDVVGNRTVSSAVILNVLEEEGVGIGSYWPAFISDSIRSRALLKLPKLSFLTVNVYGSRAEVLVRERVEKPPIMDEHAVADIYADRSGIISEINVLRGTAVAKENQTVVGGELLVRGSFVGRTGAQGPVRAIAEIKMRTWREFIAVTRTEQMVKQPTGKSYSRYTLIVGDHRISFFGSQETPENYTKLSEERPFSFEGVFTLPLTIVKERYDEYALVSVPLDIAAERTRMESVLTRQLVAAVGEEGNIVSGNFSYGESGGLYYVTLRAECEESAGETRVR